MSTNPVIQLEFTIEEINVILSALGQLPYVKVVGIIEKISKQAGSQWTAQPEPPAPTK